MTFQSLVIHCEALDHIFFQSLSGPDAELSTSYRFYSIANRNDDVKITYSGFHIHTRADVGGGLKRFGSVGRLDFVVLPKFLYFCVLFHSKETSLWPRNSE